MIRPMIRLAAFFAVAVPVLASAAGPEVRLLPTEAAAAAACGRDPVVWLNRNTGVFHLPGMKWYGKTKDGGYGCRSELERAGKTLSKAKE